jgi:hypothetical protein
LKTLREKSKHDLKSSKGLLGDIVEDWNDPHHLNHHYYHPFSPKNSQSRYSKSPKSPLGKFPFKKSPFKNLGSNNNSPKSARSTNSPKSKNARTIKLEKCQKSSKFEKAYKTAILEQTAPREAGGGQEELPKSKFRSFGRKEAEGAQETDRSLLRPGSQRDGHDEVEMEVERMEGVGRGDEEMGDEEELEELQHKHKEIFEKSSQLKLHVGLCDYLRLLMPKWLDRGYSKRDIFQEVKIFPYNLSLTIFPLQTR